MHAYMYTCSYILCGNIVLFCFCFIGATTSSIEQPTPTADSSSPGIYKYYDCVTTLIEPWIIYMYTYMDRKRVRIRSSPRSFWTTIRVTRKLMVAGAAITVPKKSLSVWTALQGQNKCSWHS